MKSHLLRQNRELLTGTIWHQDADGMVTVESRQDVQAVIDANKAQYADTDEHAPWQEQALVARIPLTIYFDLYRRGIVHDDKAMRRWLNDPANRHFRTRPGKL